MGRLESFKLNRFGSPELGRSGQLRCATKGQGNSMLNSLTLIPSMERLSQSENTSSLLSQLGSTSLRLVTCYRFRRLLCLAWRLRSRQTFETAGHTRNCKDKISRRRYSSLNQIEYQRKEQWPIIDQKFVLLFMNVSLIQYDTTAHQLPNPYVLFCPFRLSNLRFIFVLAIVPDLCINILRSQTPLFPSTILIISSANLCANIFLPLPLLAFFSTAFKIHSTAVRLRCRTPNGTGICREAPPPAAPFWVRIRKMGATESRASSR